MDDIETRCVKLAEDNVRLSMAISKLERILFDKPSLRDQFAMAALQGMISATPENASFRDPDLSALEAYTYADAMLKARNGEQSDKNYSV